MEYSYHLRVIERVGARAHFWPKNQLFMLHPYNPPFFGIRRTQLNGIISPPCPEATLDTFSFLLGGQLAAQQAFLAPIAQKDP